MITSVICLTVFLLCFLVTPPIPSIPLSITSHFHLQNRSTTPQSTMGQGRDRSQRARKTKKQMEEDRTREQQRIEAARANARRFFGGRQQQDVPREEEALPIPEDPPPPPQPEGQVLTGGPHIPPLQAPPPQAPPPRALSPQPPPVQAPPVQAPPPQAPLQAPPDSNLLPDGEPRDAEAPIEEAEAPDEVELEVLEEETRAFTRGVDSVDLSGVPELFRKHVRNLLHEFKSWWTITGNQHRSTVRGTWKWKTMEAPNEDPNKVEAAGPLEYLIPKFCRVQFFIPELCYPRHFKIGKMPCKWDGWDCTCCKRSKLFNPEGPRVVTEADGTLRLIFCSVYECTERRKTHKGIGQYSFRGYDPELLAKHLPAHVRKSLNCVLSQKAAVSVAVLEDIERSLLTSQASFASQSDKLQETLKDSFYSTEHEYYASMQHQAKRRKVTNQGSIVHLWRGFNPSKPAKFPDIEEVIPAKAYISGKVLNELYSRRSEDQQGFFQLHMQQTDTLFLKGDKSFKITKMIFTKGGGTSKAFDAIYTVMNHHGQIVAQYFTRTNGPQELKDIHAAIKKRMMLHGFENVKLMWVDDCCHEHDSIVEPFPELRDGREDSRHETVHQPMSTLERFSVSGEIGDAEPRYITSTAELASYASDLSRQQTRNSNQGYKTYLSIDCEWNEEDTPPELPHTAQVAINDGPLLNRNLVALIQLDRVTQGGTVDLPNTFKMVLSEPNTQLVGVSVQKDITNLNHHFDGLIRNPERQKRDLGVWARRIGLVQRGGSLQFLTATLFSKYLDKESPTRCSDWSLFELNDDQKEYALCDAIAGTQIALALEGLEKVHRTPNPQVEGEFVCGRIYRLFNKTGSSMVALGKITEILPQQQCHVQLFRILRPSAKAWLGNTNNASLGDVGLGNKVEWALKRIKFASSNEEAITLDEAVLAATTMQEAPPTDTDNASVSNEAEDEASDIVELPAGINLEAYPDTHGEDQATPTTAQQPAAQNHSSRARRSSRRRARRNWKRTRIKLDIFHAKKRLKDTVKKSHGCYQYFCQMVSDAFFITNPHDWEKQRQKVISRMKRNRDIDETVLAEAVRVELKRKRAKYEQQCRRSVPEPDVLEARLKSVVELFGNVEDCKTGEKFFSKKTWNAYKALVKHIRKGCLSDDPSTNHYYVVGGKLFCIRGTNALEGYHRALRRVIQQYHATPKLCIHILSAFNYRWNIDRMTDRELLPAKYGNFYKQYQIEEIQEMTYDFFDEPVHIEWNSSKGVASSGEVFYWPMDESMNATREESDDEEGTISHVPFQKISTRYERDLFDKEVTRFYRRNTGGASSENPAVMYDNHDWGRFQQWWEKKVEWNESQPLEARHAIFRKTATMLKEYYATSKRRVNREATLNQASSSGGTVANQARTLTESLRNATEHGVFHPIELPNPAARPAAVDDTGVPVGVPPVQLVGASAATRRVIAEITARYEHVGHHISHTAVYLPPGKKRRVSVCKRCGLMRKGVGHEGGVWKNSLQYCSVRDNWLPNDRIPESYRCIE